MKYAAHLHRNNIILATLVLAWVFRHQITNQIIGFLLTGALPGTSLSLPYWVMLLFCLAAIAGIILFYFNQTTEAINRSNQPKTRRASMPRRRYSNI